jgi:pimeloyl-ACP methyl ester carboxylesterase
VVWQNLRLMQRVARVNGREVLPTDFHACNAYDNGRNAALLLHCPALFVLGGADFMTPPKSAQALIDAIATDKQVVVLPDIGHNLMAEHPDGVRRALEQFARRVLGEPRPPSA